MNWAELQSGDRIEADFADALYNRSILLFENQHYESALKDADACISNNRNTCTDIVNALGRSEIYKRLEILSKSDPENIRLAAFAAFISEVEKPIV